jgi:hypothetical protein
LACKYLPISANNIQWKRESSIYWGFVVNNSYRFTARSSMPLTVNKYVFCFCALSMIEIVAVSLQGMVGLTKILTYRMLFHPAIYSVVALVFFLVGTSQKNLNHCYASAGFLLLATCSYVTCYFFSDSWGSLLKDLTALPFLPPVVFMEAVVLFEAITITALFTSGTNFPLALLKKTPSSVADIF